jgi:phage shock protein PspC (stress-responsive transcriptional regulator)
MDPVISVNLNGNAYQIEQVGYSALRAYLDRAAAQLKGNPDAAEILADLEQAIADKFRRQLGPNKTVVTAPEIAQALEEMGPVDAAAGDSPGASTTSGAGGTKTSADAASPKRLYQVREGAMISGVCQGLAMYLGIDVTIVRVIFVVLALVTQGIFVGVYFILMAVVPRATTDEEVAAAHGQPFNAKEVIDQVKRNAASFKPSSAWRRQMREQRRQWKRALHSQRRDRMGAWSYGPGVPAAAGPMTPFLHLLSVAWLFAFIFAGVSLFRTGTIFGWPIPHDIPMWVAVAGLFVLFHLIAAPLSMSDPARNGAGLVSLVAMAFVGWFMYEQVPEFHAFVDRVFAHLESLRVNR